MKKSSATFRDICSFIAGLLVGLSIAVPVFAMMDAYPGDWQALSFVGALIVLALGIALQVVATYKLRPRRGTDPELDILPVNFVPSNQVR